MEIELETRFAQSAACDSRDVTASAHLERLAIEQAVSELISARSKRCTYFQRRLFADPAWDILLLLTLAQARQQRLTVSGVCEGIDVPTTTAIRWIYTLADEGLLVRRNDITDKRRKYIELTCDAYGRMAKYCTTIASTATAVAA